MNKIDKALIVLAFVNTVKGNCDYFPYSNFGANTCDSGTCFAFSVVSFDDFDTYKEGKSPYGLLSSLALIWTCSDSAESIIEEAAANGVTITTPVEVTDELKAEIFDATTCSEDAVGCWAEH